MRQVIAMGDGGLDSKSAYVDLYILAQAGKERPKVCFLPTASGDNEGLSKYFINLFERYPCKPTVFKFFAPSTADYADFLMSQDVIYVGGGQSKTMLGVWKEWGADRILRDAYENGTVLSGGSAGSVCWFDQCITDSIPGSLTVMNCLGIIPHSNCPHFASQSRRNSYAKYIMSEEIKAGYAADDFAGIHFIDGEFHRAISGRPYAKVYKCAKVDGQYVQKRLKTKWLDLPDYNQDLVFNTPLFPRRHIKAQESKEIIKDDAGEAV